MNCKERLLQRLPKKYRDRVYDFYNEGGLTDDCSYVLVYTDKYTDGECIGGSLPCNSISEAIQFVKDLERI